MASYPANSVAESDRAGSGSASGGTGNSCSPAMRNDSRLVTSSVSQGAVREEDREVRRGGDHLLDVVEQQQESAIAQKGLQEISGGLVAHLEETKSLGDGRDDEVRIADRGERDKDDCRPRSRPCKISRRPGGRAGSCRRRRGRSA